MQDVNKAEKPKISGPKPTIPSKPKYVPPVNLKTQKLQPPSFTQGMQRPPNPNNAPDISKPQIRSSQENYYSTFKESYSVQQSVPTSNPNIMTYTRCDDFCYKEKSTTFSSTESTKSVKDDQNLKAPNSPSTVCCSILPNTGDCCGTLNVNKKDVKNGELMTKVDSLDSNSSDSGGFKDFIQPSIPSMCSALSETRRSDLKATHERKASQPELLEKKASERRNQTHQRQISQPDLTYHEPRQTCVQNKPTVVPSAQALALFLPSADQKATRGFSFHEPDGAGVNRRLSQSFMHQERTNEISQQSAKPHITTHINFQQSSKKLEELFSQRIEREKVLKKGGTCLVENENKRDIEEKLQVQKQFQQKLQADIQQTVKHIQEIQNTELRLPQNRKWSESNRSQPAIGLKHTPKSRPTIFGTVASDHTLKDCSNRRCLPQTPHTKSFSSNYNGDNAPENGDESSVHQENTLVYRDGNLLSGSLDALIQHMVPTDTYYPDRAYIFAFLLSSRLFIKPHDLLAKIRNFYEIQQGLNSSSGAGPGRARFAEHLVDLLAEWTETFPYDFRDERVMQHVQTMTQQCCILNPSLRTNVSSILHNLLQRLTSLETYEKSLEKPQVPLEDFTDDISEICPFPSTLAQQLTQLELERLSFIGPEEFVQAFAKENPLLETSFKDMKKTRNLEQYVQWFNRLSYFVATQVCKYQKKKQRVRMVEYWIETGRECFNIGNFNSLMAIISGLNMSPISRLKKTWSKIHSGKFAILEHQMDPSSNFSSYRSTLKAAMWRSAGATDQRQRIVIPFFSLLVKDLYFLNQGCSNRLPNGHINFEKFWQLAKQVTEFMAWKQVACPFEKDVRILSLLQYGTILNENSLALASFDCEPPENNQEKERCKSLKADSTTTL